MDIVHCIHVSTLGIISQYILTRNFNNCNSELLFFRYLRGPVVKETCGKTP